MAEIPQIISESERMIPFWRVPVEFAIHAIVGTLIFGVIAAFAILLNWVVARLQLLSVDRFVIYGLKGCEYALFSVDVVLFIVFLWRDGKRTFKHL